MNKIILIMLTLSVLVVFGTSGSFARGNNPGPVIYVESQGLFYDAVIAADPLPMKGPFQQLYECEVDEVVGLCTEYGPGDFGHRGGRWWFDNGDGVMDASDHFFSCPLLGPGREMP